MVTMAEIDEARGRANEAVEALHSANRSGNAAAAMVWSGRLWVARIEVEALLGEWLAQGCREIRFVEVEGLALRIGPKTEEESETLMVRVRERLERGDLVTVDGRRAAGPRCPGCGADLRTTEVKSTNPERCGACGAPVGPVYAIDGARPGAIRGG